MQVSDVIVVWTPETSGRVLFAQIRSRLVGTTNWTEQAAKADPSAGSFRFGANAPSSQVEVQIRYQMVGGAVSPWVSASITTAAVVVPYAAVTGTPTSLAAVSPSEAAKLASVETGATVGAPAGTNVAGTPATTLVSTANGAASTASTALSAVGTLGGRVTTTEGDISTLQGYAQTRWTVSAINGAGRAQLGVYANANGGGGVDIVGDVAVSGDLVIGGTITTGKLAVNAVTNILASDNGPTYIDPGVYRSSPANGTSITIASPSGSPVRIDVSLAGYLADGWPVGYYMRLIRVQNGVTSTIFDWFTSPIPVRDFFIDVPAGGTPVQYICQFANEQDGSHGQLAVTSQKLCLMEVKR